MTTLGTVVPVNVQLKWYESEMRSPRFFREARSLRPTRSARHHELSHRSELILRAKEL